jgi:hypothetical protein
MITLIAMGVIKSTLDAILNGMGVPRTEKRDQLTGEMAKCYVTFACADTKERKTEALEDFFNSMGITEWRGTTMAQALLQVLENEPKGGTMMDTLRYAMETAPALRNLLNSVLKFNTDDGEEAYTSQPATQPICQPAPQPRDSHGRFISQRQAEQAEIARLQAEAEDAEVLERLGIRFFVLG